MDWIFDNIQILIAAAAAVAYWLNQRTQAKGAEGEEPPDEVEAESLLEREEEEPKSLIPEGLQRRILDELGIPQPEVEPQPPEPLVIPSQPPPLPAAVPEPPAVLPVIPSAVQPVNIRSESPSPKSRSSVRRNALREALHSDGEIRKAMLLREILGPPVGLKPQDFSRLH